MATGPGERFRFWVAVAILCAPPLLLAVRETRDFDWPDDPDLFREGAQAQSFADGHLLADPYYKGEWIWYPPLVPAIVAGLSKLTGAPVPAVYARAGAYLNMLGPILLAALVARCFGSLSGLVALTVFLYRIPRGPTGVGPFYSTHLYSGNFAQVVFFLALLVYVGLPEKSRLRYALTGLLLGLTFLGHAGAFLVLAGIFIVEFIRDAARDPRGAIERHGLLFAMAALAASVQILSILGHYHLEIRNPVPMQWVHNSATWPFLQRQIDRYTLLALVALVVLWFRGPAGGKWVLSGWCVSSLGFTVYSFVAEAFAWPPVVPRHHLVHYARALQPVLIGYGAFALWSWVRPGLERRGLLAWPKAPVGRELAKWVLVTGGAALAIALLLPHYAKRTAGSGRTGIVDDTTLQAGLDAYRYIRSSLRFDDVVLATDDRGLLVVGPAGAKVVALDALFSNLYVDRVTRARARDEMFAALERGDEAAFEALADAYAVTHVLWLAQDGPSFDPRPIRSLVVEFQNKTTKLYRRVPR